MQSFCQYLSANFCQMEEASSFKHNECPRFLFISPYKYLCRHVFKLKFMNILELSVITPLVRSLLINKNPMTMTSIRQKLSSHPDESSFDCLFLLFV